MDSISRVRDLLVANAQTGGQQLDPHLFSELRAHTAEVQLLFNAGSPNPGEQRDLQAGKAVVDGKSLAVNADFAKQSMFLAQQLNCSEFHVAGLLHAVMLENSNITPVAAIEAALVRFHLRRRHLTDILRLALEGAEFMGTNGTPTVCAVEMDRWVRKLLHPFEDEPAKKNFAETVFQTMNSLGDTIAKAQNDVQGAVSDTVLDGNMALGYEVLATRHSSLLYERRMLATVLLLAARLGYFGPREIQFTVEWIFTNPHHPMTFYVLATILHAFEFVSPTNPRFKLRHGLATDRASIGYMTKKVAPATVWSDPGLKSVILLKWTLFLTETRHHDITLELKDGFKTEQLETQVWNAVQGDAFNYIALALIQIDRKQASFTQTLQLSWEQEHQREVPSPEFQPVVLYAFENLVRSLITHASSELRKIKQRQEDVVASGARSRNMSTSVQQPRPRNDVATLYSVIGLLYSALPGESALQFWGAGGKRKGHQEEMESQSGRLPAFLQWAVWSTLVRDMDTSMALYDMLAGLAKGQQCSELAYNFMARGSGDVLQGSTLSSSSSSSGGPTVSWSVIFSLLDSWASPRTVAASPPPPQNGGVFGGWQSHSQSQSQAHQPSPQQLALGPKDVLLAQAFLRLLSNVVTHSVSVRIAISSHAQFRAIPTLVSLVPLGVPLELKGAIFETLAAFCEPGAGSSGVEICKAVWLLMEKLEVINVRAGQRGVVSPRKGVEAELEDVESVARLYPSTIPFLKLLSTLIHSPKRILLKTRFAQPEPLNTIPETLGQPYRLPGVGPFVSFVIDTVFCRISSREYVRPSDRWQTNDLCLSFIERSLASYELESLVADDTQLSPESLHPLLVHPAFEIVKRLLTASPLQETILSYVVQGVEGFEKKYAEEEPFFRTTITRVLRIILRVLEIQDIFIDVLIPLLAEFDSSPLIGTVHSRNHFTRLDRSLSFDARYVPAIAAYVAFPDYSEVVLMSIKILTVLSTSGAFTTNLMTLIEKSNESERILAGFTNIMAAETNEDVLSAETDAEEKTGAGAPDVHGAPFTHKQAVKLAVLDLFIKNTEPGRAYPNIAHLLLFGGGNYRIQDPHALGARYTPMHVILDTLSVGIPKARGRNHGTPLYVALPALAERYYRVVYQLCVHPKTSEFSMRYLRSREDFFARQLAAIPSQVPEVDVDESQHEDVIEMRYGDGSRIVTTVTTASAFLRLRSWIFDLVALDLHALTHKGQAKGVLELLDILFSANSEHRGLQRDWEEDVLQPFQEVGQSHLRIIEFVQSLAFDWADRLVVAPVELEFLGNLNLASCVRKDASGCEIVDRTAIVSLMMSARRALNAQGRILTSAHIEQIGIETAYVLESCAVENHRREIRHATSAGYESWRRLLDITLTKCFSRLAHERREGMLFDLLHVLPATIRSADLDESTAVLLSETILSTITKLREDRRHQVVVQSAGGDPEAGSLPAERLYALLRSILECIMDSNHLELVRGNLYSALINYLHLIAPTSRSPSLSSSMSMSLSRSTSRDDVSFSESRGLDGNNDLEMGSLALMKQAANKLVATVARDAIDGTEVWKTVAFLLLDSLIQLSRLEKQHVVLGALVRHGVMSNFVRGIADSDLRLQAVLKPDPDDLNPLYVYEAKMSMFIRISQTRAGAERLLDAGILSTLAKCDYLDARPESDQSFMDQDTFLPSAIQRYHQLFMPALQLIVGMLATLGPKHTTAANKALEFLSSHRDTIVILIRNETEYVPLALVEEIHLLISLCSSVLPLVPKTELVSVNSGFGGIHGAILGFSTQCLGSGQWSQNIKPQTESELIDASVYASGYSTGTKFEARVRQKERLLRKAIIVYIGTASEFTEPEITLVLSPVTNVPRHEESHSRFQATIPTVGDAIEALNELGVDLSEMLEQIADIQAELASREHIAVDNIQDIITGPDVQFLRDLDIGQKRALICRELERLSLDANTSARALTGTTEMLLLLLWRHISYYSEGQHINNPLVKMSTTHGARFLSSAPDADTFRVEVARKIAPALQRLESLDLDPDALGKEWRSSQGYLQIMCRRLRDAVELQDVEDDE